MTLSPLEILTPSPDGWTWSVLHTKPRCEKKVVALSALKQADFFLPCTRRAHEYGSRTRFYDVPLFTGYVFGRMPEENVPWFRSNHYIANIIPVLNEEKLLSPLRAIATALESGMEMDVLPEMVPGSKVKITAGPLKGLETEVFELRGKDTVVIQLEMIQKSVAVEIQLSHLKRIP